ncbi:hypothetical protein CXP40_12700 [Pseudomonas sp. YY-1]|uniref:hypothetical protein n=1 Tax=Pseudomonas sp. YY-1 TaxID=2058659 RepID=UPI000CABA4E5|nr:hypothetical protein [Pseudomonas sp. YY-1]PKQ41252.1 hypothetical protein CXP40_12700 [Pseudomonas sp. YY-1]
MIVYKIFNEDEAGYVMSGKLLLLFTYLVLNVLNVGDGGTALPLLGAFFVLSGISLLLDFFRCRTAVHGHFFVFLLFVVWLTYRILVDLNDLAHLKKLTVATTSGILLFFLLGTFARQALDKINTIGKLFWLKFLFAALFLFYVWVFISFNNRLLSSGEIFYMDGVNGDYQRPGNFMICLFLMCSFVLLNLVSRLKANKKKSLLVYLAAYFSMTILNLVSSQAMGANTATACILAIYMMSFVLALLYVDEDVRDQYLRGVLSIPFSVCIFKGLFKYSLVVVSFSALAAFALVQATSFDLQKTRIFGFGSGVNSSITSRMEILREEGAEQIGNALLFGNLDVARLVSDDPSRTLHSFFPNIIAELGLIGFSIVALLLILIVRHIFVFMRCSAREESGFLLVSIGLWLFFILGFLFFYANLAVGKEWSVMWFFLGFAVNVFPSRSSFKSWEDERVPMKLKVV